MPDKNNIFVGSRFREERQRLGMNQEQLAGKLEVVARTISRWEKGEPIPSDRLIECATLGMDIQYVLFQTNKFGNADQVEESRELGAAEAQNVDMELLGEVIRRVEERIAKPGLKFTEYSAEDKAKVIVALYKSFSETGLAPRQHDPAVLSVLELMAS